MAEAMRSRGTAGAGLARIIPAPEKELRSVRRVAAALHPALTYWPYRDRHP